MTVIEEVTKFFPNLFSKILEKNLYFSRQFEMMLYKKLRDLEK